FGMQESDTRLQGTQVRRAQPSRAEERDDVLIDDLPAEASVNAGTLLGVVSRVEQMTIGVPDTGLILEARSALAIPPNSLAEIADGKEVEHAQHGPDPPERSRHGEQLEIQAVKGISVEPEPEVIDTDVHHLMLAWRERWQGLRQMRKAGGAEAIDIQVANG